MLNKQNSYTGIDNGIRKIINILENIDDGHYLQDIKNQFQDFDFDTWIEEHKSDGLLGSGHGILLPIDKDLRLLSLLGIFKIIQESSFENFLNRFYSEDLLSTGMELIASIAGVYAGLRGDSSLNFKTMERHRKKEIENVSRFNDEISSEFERLLLDDLEIKYPKKGDKVIMGDYFENITNSTIINKSIFLDVVEKEQNLNVRNALIELKKKVEDTGNEEAVGLYNDFLEELSLEQPKKRKLKSFWNSLLDTLPKIKDLTDITVGITSLFS